MRDRFAKDYEVVMIDTDRMTGGKAVANELRHGQDSGIPWLSILDGDGKERITSTGPQGNIGCPVQPHEIEHFLVMIDQTRRHMSATDRGVLERELRAHALALTGAAKTPGYSNYRRALEQIRTGQFDGAVEDLATALQAGFPTGRIPVDPALRPLREDPDQRTKLMELSAKHAAESRVQLIDRLEPGRRIRLSGRVVDMATGTPLAGALIRLFHTDASGEYRPGMDAGGGAGNPRLWGYVRTDDQGRFTADTIMPERYTNSTVPRHVHYHVWAEGYPKLVSECFFDSDPLLGEKTRKEAPSRNFPIVELATDDAFRTIGELTIRVPKS